ncbi:MAG: M20/M25/M40 family metallo-hydrolase [bacterium]|nr:M20/M25/M40 family metallo-hydrolase [bacterium]
MVRNSLLIVIIGLGGCASSGVARRSAPDPLVEQYRPVAATIIEAVRHDHNAYDKLEQLCDGIGHRLSGSPQLEKAIDWAIETMRADGLKNARREMVMVPRWVRGAESLAMTKPMRYELPMLGLGGSVGTPPEGITAEVVSVPDETGLEALGDGARGKIVLFDNPMPEYDPEKGAGYGTTVRFRGKGARLAAKHGAVACLVRSVTAISLRTPHTGAMRYGDAEVKIPAAAITTEDAAMITRLCARGERVVAMIKMEARNEGLVPSANVVGELPGSTHPDEIVVLSGHFDSWDVGHGAHDDAGGCVLAMEAVAVLRRLNLVPRRTLRVVLWVNEENGLAGAKQYLKDHQDELTRHVAAIESDSGIFRPLGYSVDMADPDAKAAAADRLRSLLTLLEPVGATQSKAGGSGGDIGRLKPYGPALLGFSVDGSKYFDYHHSPADTLDKIDRDDLTDCLASMAVMGYILADMPGRLGDRPEQSPTEPATD